MGNHCFNNCSWFQTKECEPILQKEGYTLRIEASQETVGLIKNMWRQYHKLTYTTVSYTFKSYTLAKQYQSMIQSFFNNKPMTCTIFQS
jgi:hypothetical protein